MNPVIDSLVQRGIAGACAHVLKLLALVVERNKILLLRAIFFYDEAES